MMKPMHASGDAAPALLNDVRQLIEQARAHVASAANSAQTLLYWQVGERIRREVLGEARADYGEQIVSTLSTQLVQAYGQGFGLRSLRRMVQFSEAFPDAQMVATLSRELSWSHLRLIIRVDSPQAIEYYCDEARTQNWTVRQLERNIQTKDYQRLLSTRAQTSDPATKAAHLDFIKDPYVLEFLDLPESHRLVESRIEEALINQLQAFLLELGSGFAFVGRQRRLTLDGDHFYPDLVFYHVKLKCYVVIDLKVGKPTHGDLGQMQLYVNYYDREVAAKGDNPTIGLLLCSEKNDAVVRYVLGDKTEQIFASRYQFALPSEDDLRAEIRREMEQFQPLELREPLEPLAPSKPLEQREGTSAKVQRAATGKPKTPATKTTKSRSKSTAAKGTEK